MERKTKGEVLRNANGTKGNRLGEKKADFLLPKQAQGIIRRTVFRDETKRGARQKTHKLLTAKRLKSLSFFSYFQCPRLFLPKIAFSGQQIMKCFDKKQQKEEKIFTFATLKQKIAKSYDHTDFIHCGGFRSGLLFHYHRKRY
ncbi:MAG: hypothetical protein PUH24_02825 [Prevotellaceae bacterium]|nr:hypothetical protein [Prevotella sp.]MDD7257202.1 hypothetical protein [Prevotellaceae bacterium]MDY6129944.1 hypothetical protein [Prevotella sp.]